MAFRSGMPLKASAKHHALETLTFLMYTADEIRKLSVVEITTPQSFNVLGHPYNNGLYDPRMGPISDKSDPCGTCGKNISQCTGHFGSIELPLPVVNAIFYKQYTTIIKLSCLECCTIQLTMKTKETFIEEMKNVNENSFLEVDEFQKKIDTLLSTISLKKYNKCINKSCGKSFEKAYVSRNKILISKYDNNKDDNDNVNDSKTSKKKLLTPKEGKNILRKIWINDSELLKLILPCLKFVELDNPTDIFFNDVVAVLPPTVRPTNYVDGQMIEHPQTLIYKSIMEDCLILRNIIKVIQDKDTSKLSDENITLFDKLVGNTSTEKLNIAWESLQSNVDHLMDRNINTTHDSANVQGVKQIIEKKAGIIRMHMMGKRVNFAARSVITPDPNLNIDEIGIPEAFALKLTYPVPVTTWNCVELRKLIMNGPNIYPGAVMIEDEFGFVKRLNPNDDVSREAISKRLLTPGEKIDKYFDGIKIVHRHLQNGDILLLNRQPTLHRPSLMAHKARILKGEKTIRMHYSNCKSYNADFDGDEMNVHFPQGELARSEGYNIANVSNNYLVPKDGTPLGGLIQDHVISGVKLTVRGEFFSREDYFQLVYAGLPDHRGDIITLPPTILKPIQLWSGKQVVSTVIINLIPKNKAKINLTAGTKISEKDWQIEKPRKWKCGNEFSDSKTMSEAQLIIRNGELLSGVLDKTHDGATTYGLIHCTYELYGGECSSRMLSSFGKLFLAHLQITGFTLGIHDILLVPEIEKYRRKQIKKYRQIGDKIQKDILELSDDNNLTHAETIEKIEESYSTNPKFRATVDSKYKEHLSPFTGDMNNICVKNGLLKKFPSNNLQLMVQSGAKGSTVNTMQISGHLGQIELEGKRPPLMISGRSLPSFAPYDSSPRAGGFIDGRFMTGIEPQEFFFHCMAGREGLIDTAVKTSRSGYLQRCCVKHLEGITVQYDLSVRDFDGSLIQLLYGEDGLDIGASKFLTKQQIDFLANNKDAILGGQDNIIDNIKGEKLNERLELLVDDYIKNNSKKLYNNNMISKKDLRNILLVKCVKAMCPPGEAVGLLAAQSIGEPSTQMTLNTFHFAGRGEMNVTLGIPRLREILMTASKNIKTPSMEIPFKNNIEKFDKKSNKLKIKLTKCVLSDILKEINIERKLSKYPERQLEYQLEMIFLPHKYYKHKFCISSYEALIKTEEQFYHYFFKELKKIISTEDKSLIKIDTVKKDNDQKKDASLDDDDDDDNYNSNKKKQHAYGESHISSDEDDDDAAAGDEDATASKKKSKRQENQEYDDDDSEDDNKDDKNDDNENDDNVDDNENIKKENTQNDNDEDDEVKLISKKKKKNELKSRKQDVIESSDYAHDYIYDENKSLWSKFTFKLDLKLLKTDLTTAIRTAASKTILWEVKEIKRAFIYKNDEKKNELLLKTDGININEMYKYRDILDINRLYSNDIYRISQTYGIEAATNIIFQEVKNVFKLYGITVDSRHLSLIADYMTLDGTFKPLSRAGMEDSTSPLLQMSFESSVGFLKDATIKAKTDFLVSPSSRLMIGQPCKSGTGCFGLYLKTPAMKTSTSLA
ncbi:hypothetical protein HCN44_009752 [Aphidius gifuensis]|uniref:DNA-directed RNA polymerase subunit n=1 Tax=Aphidius gifuensis TaxID=684658 RepID=A0A835CVR5_APHGI|nr:DNA-directed RNA polymerase I subunit RPA1 [Aphidius gifuensis]KAF7998354.1 hypothetical protein HCN44_009752 [Aphidius gifuensis]